MRRCRSRLWRESDGWASSHRAAVQTLQARLLTIQMSWSAY